MQCVRSAGVAAMIALQTQSQQQVVPQVSGYLLLRGAAV
jgi:hypothetical protein